MQRCRKNAYMVVLKIRISHVNRDVTKMYANYCLWNGCCSISKVEMISLAFKWLIVLRLAINTRDQTHRVLKNECLLHPKINLKKTLHLYASSTQAVTV